jgi:hypothetical protein
VKSRRRLQPSSGINSRLVRLQHWPTEQSPLECFGKVNTKVRTAHLVAISPTKLKTDLDHLGDRPPRCPITMYLTDLPSFQASTTDH